jgi:hypothetical protein
MSSEERTESFEVLGRIPWKNDQPFARTTQTQNKGRQTSLLRVGFEHKTPFFVLAKTFKDSDCAAAVIGVVVLKVT